jgi:hypothetical protein
LGVFAALEALEQIDEPDDAVFDARPAGALAPRLGRRRR